MVPAQVFVQKYASCRACVGHTYLKSMVQFIPLVQQATVCQIGNGELTSFWSDKWCLAGRFAELFPTLFTFARGKGCLVSSQFQGYWDIKLHPNLSRTAWSRHSFRAA